MGQLAIAGASTRALLSVPALWACCFLTALILPALYPFDVEKYLRFHYTKTREQTVVLLKLFMKDGLDCGTPVDNIERLLNGLLRAD